MATRKKSPKLGALHLAFIAFVSLALVLVTAEVASRFIWPEIPGIANRHLEPYLMGGRDDPEWSGRSNEDPAAFGYHEAGGIWVHDSARPVRDMAERGSFLFRDEGDEVTKLAQRPRDQLLVFVVGGSVAAGNGGPGMKMAWFERLEQLLKQNMGPKVLVRTLGVPSFVSTQERILLDQLALPHCPDLVIILNGFNDASAQGTGARPGDPFNMGVLYKGYDSLWFHLKRRLGRYSHFVRVLVNGAMMEGIHRQSGVLQSDPNVRRTYVDSVTAVYESNLRAMARSCEAASVPCLTLLQPGRGWTLHGAQTDPQNLPADFYRRVAPRLSLLRKHGVNIRDVAPAFASPEGQAWLFDGVHFGDGGQEALARTILPWVLDELKRGAGSRARCSKKMRPIPL